MLVVVAFLAGCGGGDDDGSASGALADGRHFGYVRAVDTGSEPATIEFDVAGFLLGDEADAAGEQDGVIQKNEGVPNDYYIENEDETAVTLVVSPDVTVTRVQCPAGCEEGAPGDFAGLAASFAGSGYTLNDEYRGAESQYWVTLEGGVVVAIDEQYVP